VAAAQAELIAAWMSVGFIHGVMNTDNMAISGETIDYGPCAFMDRYDESAVFSSIDTGGRYRFGNQPPIAAWNLSRFAESLLPLIAEDTDAAVEIANAEINRFNELYDAAWLRRMRLKLGLPDEAEVDLELVTELLGLMQTSRLDFTSTWRGLARDLRGDTDAVRGQVLDLTAYDAWRGRWVSRLGDAQATATAEAMDGVNPAYIPRNHLVEEALESARDGDLTDAQCLLEVTAHPFTEQSGRERFADPAPDAFTDSYLTYCGT
jgi:uncharacterized protein YdiU (UPF0061 family)